MVDARAIPRSFPRFRRRQREFDAERMQRGQDLPDLARLLAFFELDDEP
jgi:hypothetical protein